MPSSVSPLVIPDALHLDLKAATAEDAVRELHAALALAPAVNDQEQLLRDLLARLALGSLCLSADIALPHTRTTAVNGFVFAVGRSSAGIAFDEQHPCVRLVFLVAVRPAAVSEYLRWVAHLTRTLRSPALRQALLDAPTPEAFQGVWSRGFERLAS